MTILVEAESARLPPLNILSGLSMIPSRSASHMILICFPEFHNNLRADLYFKHLNLLATFFLFGELTPARAGIQNYSLRPARSRRVRKRMPDPSSRTSSGTGMTEEIFKLSR